MRRLTALAVFCAVACGPARYGTLPPPPVLAPMLHGARCTFDPTTLTIPEGAILYAADRSDASIARLSQSRARLEGPVVFAPEGSKRASVTLAFPSEGPAFHVSGWLSLDAIDLAPTKDVVLLPDRVWIPAGARVGVIAGEGDRVRIVSTFAYDALDFAADVPCATLVGFGSIPATRPPPRPSAPKWADGPMHLVGDFMTIYDDLEGKPMRRVKPEIASAFDLWLLQEGGGFAHVLHDTPSLHLDAWVPSFELAHGDAHDCDDCDGRGIADAVDACDDHEEPFIVGDGCPGLVEAKATRDVALRFGDHVVGSIDVGARVYLLPTKGADARVGIVGVDANAPGFSADRDAFAPISAAH